jgi:hypothetical protein
MARIGLVGRARGEIKLLHTNDSPAAHPRMAESKSDRFSFDFKVHSEKSSKFASLPINKLALDTECDSM